MKSIAIAQWAFAFSFLFNGSALAKPIGYGCSDAVLPLKNQEAFLSGFEIGFDHVMGTGLFNQQVEVKRATDKQPLAATRLAKDLLKDGAVILTGFPTSHEALQAAPIAREQKILSIFPSAGHSSLAQFGPYVFSTGENMKRYMTSLTQFLSTHYGRKAKGIYVYNPSSVFSMNQRDELAALLAKPAEGNLTPQLDFVSINRTQSLEDSVFARLKAGEFSYIFVSMYPNEAVNFIEGLTKRGIDLPIVTNSSWTTTDLNNVRRLLLHFKSELISSTVWIPGSPSSATFEKLYRKRFGDRPTNDVAAGFDVGVVVGRLVKRIKGPITRESLYNAFHSDRCFEGTSVGNICFPPEGGQAIQKVTFVKLRGNTFEAMK